MEADGSLLNVNGCLRIRHLVVILYMTFTMLGALYKNQIDICHVGCAYMAGQNLLLDIIIWFWREIWDLPGVFSRCVFLVFIPF